MSDNNKKKEGTYSALTGFSRAVPIILAAIAVFCAVCFITGEAGDTGVLGKGISNVFSGLFSIGGYFVPFLLIVHAFFYPSDVYKKRILSRTIFSIVALIMISTTVHAISYWNADLVFSLEGFYRNGTENKGGGAVGGTVAYALTAVFGYVGLIIIAAVVFALYITYFFASGKSAISKLLLKILTAISDLFGGNKEKREKKQQDKLEKEKSRKTRALAEVQEELLDDEFFAADNGLKELTIPVLGIREVRSDSELEANPVLQNKVHHTAYIENTEEKKSPFTSFEEAVGGTARSNTSFTYDDPFFTAKTPEKQETSNRKFGLDENAGDVFTKDFDPFDLKFNEELLNKQSTKTPTNHIKDPDGITEISTPISEAEIEMARRRADFEMRKKAALEAQARYKAAEEEIKATLETETQLNEQKPPVIELHDETPPVVTDTMVKTETITYDTHTPFIPEYMKNAEMKVYPTPEKIPVVVDFTEEEAEYITAELKTQRTMLNPTYETVINVTAEPMVEQIRETETAKTEYTPFVSEQKTERLAFEFETEVEEEIIEEEIITETNIVPEEETLITEEEIPESEQNDDVKNYRKLFNFLDEEDKLEDEKTAEVVPEQLIFDDDDDDEIVTESTVTEEIDDELDDVPFTPTVKIAEDSVKVTEEVKKEEEKPKKVDYSDYKFPPFDLLIRGTVEEDPDQEQEKNQNAEILVDSLSQFNVRVSIKGVDRGPRITRYEIVPVRGVKVSSVTSLFNDVALRLGAEGIRMEAPIPGKSAIGVEIPNKKPTTVVLRDLVESDEFIRAQSKTMCCLGKDVTGNPVFADISKMPHVLVAGATGMGKSVCINAILMSILYKARPDEVKFIMIDPKKVEFKGYNGIPHLLIPVVTDVKQAAGALMWAVEQMEKRYEIMEQFDVKKIDTYNEQVKANPALGEPLPKIIIVIDELNDIMLQVRKPAEDLIMSIAQKARAAGIHLIIGTQRPSVDVITGVIKANIPSRISCKVASYTDSKTILEQAGAEKLLNNGDMLYISAGAPKALRVQGAFVSDGEVTSIIKHIKGQAKGNLYDEQALEEINKAAQKCSKGGKNNDDDFDEDGEENTGLLNDQQFLDAVDLAIKSGKVSTSLIQRKISVGYSKAAKFIDAMEELGIVSEPNGQKPRDILLTKDEWHEMLSRRSLD